MVVWGPGPPRAPGFRYMREEVCEVSASAAQATAWDKMRFHSPLAVLNRCTLFILLGHPILNPCDFPLGPSTCPNSCLL